MNHEFNHDLLKEDIAAVKQFFFGFTKSFGPSPQKSSFGDVMYTRFRLNLVEMGISNIIRSVIIIVVGIIVYFTMFRHASYNFKVFIAIAFFLYYVWLFLDNHNKAEKGGSILAATFVSLHKIRVDVYESISSIFSSTPAKKK